MSEKTVTLTKPIIGHGGEIREITIREPKGRDWIQLGDPWVYRPGPDGVNEAHPVPDVIDAYFDRCITKPGPELLPQLSLADGMRVREALLGFFVVAAAAAFSSPATSSSSS